jgi:hypothetical protein
MSDVHQHTFSPAEWPFDDPVNVGAFATISVMERRDPILFAAHADDDGSWEFHTGEAIPDGQLKYVCLGCIFERDRSIGELADLPYGWEASRKDRGLPWQRQISPPEDDIDG